MSDWTDHVKRWAAAHGKTYGCAITDPKCKAAYKSGTTSKAPKPPKPPKAPKEPKAPRNPLRGKSTRKLYVANETARDALQQFRMSKGRKPLEMIGVSPSRVMESPSSMVGMSPSRVLPF